MRKKNYTAAEKRSWLHGLFTGLRRKGKVNMSVSPKPRKKWYSFLAFNDNGDVFNVEAYDSSRGSALNQARSKLKRDPEMPCWSVSVTNDKGDKDNYFRTVSLDDNFRGGIHDNWKPHYRERDEEIRRKYGGDLSKPLKNKGGKRRGK